MGNIETSGFSVFRIFGTDYSIPYLSDKRGTKEDILVYSTVLFAMRGYADVSMKDIAAEIGIQSASLYNHFPSKEAIWRAVVAHTEKLYRLYHDKLAKSLESAGSLEEVLEIIFCEPEKMSNSFTCFAFSLIQSEQFRDEEAWRVFRETFVEYAIDVLSAGFDRCVRLGFAPEFDTRAVSTAFLYCVLQQVNAFTQMLMGREVSYDPRELLKRYRAHLLRMLSF
ncbi:MAG: TetR/AcrR family transcriptional regulator [Oscillospiraceae bacterium]|jgi:AcrR family transcriptional regulator|nr:TetR/AcrR family transcriptional regulator [Oscillospiraceae bacterium]